MGTKICITELSVNNQDFSSVSLSIQGMTRYKVILNYCLGFRGL
jgi:hypothetical protein